MMPNKNVQHCSHCRQRFAVRGSQYCREHQPFREKIPGMMYLTVAWRAFKEEWRKNHPPRPRRQKSTRQSVKQSRLLQAMKVFVLVLLFLLVGLFLLRSVLTAAPPPLEEVIQTPTPTSTPTASLLPAVVSTEDREQDQEVVSSEGILNVETIQISDQGPRWVSITACLEPLGDGSPKFDCPMEGQSWAHPLSGVEGVTYFQFTGLVVGEYYVAYPKDLDSRCRLFPEGAQFDIGQAIEPGADSAAWENPKIQIVCGQVVLEPTPTVVRTSPPQETPTDPPDTPEPTSTPTSPPPTDPPPTEVICVSCLPPLTPVPTPTPYPPSVPTPTSVFDD